MIISKNLMSLPDYPSLKDNIIAFLTKNIVFEIKPKQISPQDLNELITHPFLLKAF